MATGTITVQEGDDASLTFTLKNADGSTYSGGGTFTLNVMRAAGSPVLITRSVSATATITFNLTEAELDLDVRAYRYELVVIDGLGNRRTSGLKAFYVTENNGQPGTVAVVIGSNQINVSVTLSQSSTIVTSVNSRMGDVVLTKADVGLSQVDNTSNANKPVSAATSTALGLKADKTYVDAQDAVGASVAVNNLSTETAARVGSDQTLTTALAAKYTKPGTGIPRTDLDAGTQTSLGKADTALQMAPVSCAAARKARRTRTPDCAPRGSSTATDCSPRDPHLQTPRAVVMCQ